MEVFTKFLEAAEQAQEDQLIYLINFKDSFQQFAVGLTETPPKCSQPHIMWYVSMERNGANSSPGNSNPLAILLRSPQCGVEVQRKI